MLQLIDLVTTKSETVLGVIPETFACPETTVAVKLICRPN